LEVTEIEVCGVVEEKTEEFFVEFRGGDLDSSHNIEIVIARRGD
jgi:hypothetical protein